MAVIGWGKPQIYVSQDGSSWTAVPTPVEGSTQLITTKGDKTEAKIEGGENEDVRYGKNTYSLEFQIRVTASKGMPFTASDGVVEGNWSCAVIPEDPTVPGIKIPKCVVSTEDTWTAAEGGMIKYTLDAIKEDEDTDQVLWGVFTEGNVGNFQEQSM